MKKKRKKSQLQYDKMTNNALFNNKIVVDALLNNTM